MSPSARRADLVAAARAVLTEETDTGVAEIAHAAQVSKALLYRYFPAGRSELVGAVVADLADELLAQVDQAAGMPFSPAVRLEQMLAAVFAFFVAEPGAYALLVGPVGDGSSDEASGEKRAARIGLVSTISRVLADAGRAPGEVHAAATGTGSHRVRSAEIKQAPRFPRAAEVSRQATHRAARRLAQTG